MVRSARRAAIYCVGLALFLAPPALGFQPRREVGRFDSLVIEDPVAILGTVAMPLESVPPDDPARRGWEAFRAAHGQGWTGYVDRRSGAPLLIEGVGIPWIPGRGNELREPSVVTIETLEASLRAFLANHAAILLARDAELVLDQDASGRITPDVWSIVFGRSVRGVPVAGARYVFTIGHGNLVSFGATRWGRIEANPVPEIGAGEARSLLRAYMGLERGEADRSLEPARLLLVPLARDADPRRRFEGAVGDGYGAALVWRLVLRVSGEPGTWVGLVDAHSGEILSFRDADRYSQVKGGVYPETGDQICPEGCEQAGYPMPYADVDVGGALRTAGSMGVFDCSPGGAVARTTLTGPYVAVYDSCGPLSQTAVCPADVDLGRSGGIDCAPPAGSSLGDTHASRTSFYHLNRAAEHARAWLPSNPWLARQVSDNVNADDTCNAFWDGTVNFYKSGGGCNNTGEIAGVVVHEWGHGLDENDGGGYDNPSEAYADTSALLYNHNSCIGRGFFQGQQCAGYGNACLDCTGIRDQDWDRRAHHTPSTAAAFLAHNCPPGGGPCGKEEHCEGYLAAETIWDLAVRDLPASGIDPDTSWQLVDRLWYLSRQGSGDSAYHCAIPDSDGCGATTWFGKLRNVDDDDGNLGNGTPHAAAIFAAFARHGIACGSAADASNRSYSICPALPAPALSGSSGSASALLSWTPVSSAATYNVFRNDMGCSFSFTIAGTIEAPTATFTDRNLANDFAEYYRVQAVGENPACVGPVSACVSVTPRPFAGSIALDRATYGWGVVIEITVIDANVTFPTTAVTIGSTSEPASETVVLAETELGSARYVGTILTTAAPAAADGRLSIADGDRITARYVDADDGDGGEGIPRNATADADCELPVISEVGESEITDTETTIRWTTDQPADSLVTWGRSMPPASATPSPAFVTSHAIRLTGLEPCAVYYYEVSSTDPSGNRAIHDNRGGLHHFETLGRLASAGLAPCHSGGVFLDRDAYACSDAVGVRIIDVDLNADPAVAETVFLHLDPDPEVPGTYVVRASSTAEIEPEPMALTETGSDTSVFVGTIPTAPGSPVADGALQVADGDLVTVTYRDLDDGSGSSANAIATARVDCAGPGISNLTVTDQPPFRAVVSWNTSEPATGRIDYGPTPALGTAVTDSVATLSHSLNLSPLDPCTLQYFRVSSIDVLGNASVGDRDGLFYTFQTGRVPGAVFLDGLESPGGWTLQGEWEIGEPEGKGATTGYGFPDPASAYNGNQVLGTDLSGLGVYPGDVEPGAEISATSPTIDASGLAHGKLILRRWLNLGGYDYGDHATVDGYGQGWNTVWSNSRCWPAQEHAWSLQSYDVSGLADGNAQFRIRFTLSAGGSKRWSGWNVDDVILKDGSLPDSEACGGCASPPAFDGLESARDEDPCAQTGILLTWRRAAAWGSGSTGTYAVYRDTVPSFTPSRWNLVEHGLTQGPFTDLSAPAGATLYYLVRAENDETCSTGPNNGGVTDEGRTYRSARDEGDEPVPGGVGAAVRTDKVNEAHLRLTWTAAQEVVSYRVYRAGNPRMAGAVVVGSTPGLFFDVEGELANAEDRYYEVRGVSACGAEGP